RPARTDAMLTIAPPLAAADSAGSAARTTHSTLRAFALITASKLALVASGHEPAGCIPALLTTISMRSNRASGPAMTCGASPPLGRRILAYQRFDIWKFESLVTESWRHRRAGQRPRSVAAAPLPHAFRNDDLRLMAGFVVGAQHRLFDASIGKQQQQTSRRAG